MLTRLRVMEERLRNSVMDIADADDIRLRVRITHSVLPSFTTTGSLANYDELGLVVHTDGEVIMIPWTSVAGMKVSLPPTKD